jgi:hypothetical protein
VNSFLPLVLKMLLFLKDSFEAISMLACEAQELLRESYLCNLGVYDLLHF